VRLPTFSIATKLYLVFALLATVTLALAAISVSNARRHAALTDQFGSAFIGAMNVERVNALIYAVVMESRGIYMSRDIATAKVYGEGLLVFNQQIKQVMDDWRRSVGSEDAELFDVFANRVEQFRAFRRELVRRGVEIGPEAGREWGDNDANRSVRKALNDDLTRLAQVYAERSRRIYEAIDRGMAQTAWVVAVTGALAVLLAVLGAVIIGRKIARPLARITRLTEAVAAGKTEGNIPYTDRRDEVGALARSIAFF
jgi:methyl-accepting chemotaxis protein